MTSAYAANNDLRFNYNAFNGGTQVISVLTVFAFTDVREFGGFVLIVN